MRHTFITSLAILLNLLFVATADSQHLEEPPAPTAEQDKLDKISTSLDSLQKKVDNLQTYHYIRDIGPTVVGLGSLVVTIFISFCSLKRNAELTRRSIEEKAREEDRKSIREKLDQFYGPFTQFRGLSKHFYDIFTSRISEDLKVEYRDAEGKFRTLIALTRGHKFAGVEKNLLDEIVRIGAESEKLILEKVGLVDDVDLQKLFWKAATHYRIIRLASEDKLTGGGAEFDSFTFPYELDSKIEEKMNSLNKRLEQLQKM